MSTDSSSRYTGLLHIQTPDSGYAFFLNVIDGAGKPVAEYQGKCGLFVSRKAVQRAVGRGRSAFWAANEKRMSFLVCDSDRHQGKKEARDVRQAAQAMPTA